MMKFIKTSKIKQEQAEKTKKSIVQGIKINSMILSLIIVCLIILSGTFYLIQVNKVATKGYQIRDFEQQIKELEENNKKLATEKIKLESNVEIEKRIANLGMVRVNSIDYVEDTHSAVAVAQ